MHIMIRKRCYAEMKLLFYSMIALFLIATFGFISGCIESIMLAKQFNLVGLPFTNYS